VNVCTVRVIYLFSIHSDSDSDSDGNIDWNLHISKLTEIIDATTRERDLIIKKGKKEEEMEISSKTLERLTHLSQYLVTRRNGATTIEASMQIARSVNRGPYYACMLRRWAKYWISNEVIPYFKQGRHVKIRSLLEDEDVSLAIEVYLRENKFDVTPKLLKKYLEMELFPKMCLVKKTTIDESTVRRWMIKVS